MRSLQVAVAAALGLMLASCPGWADEPEITAVLSVEHRPASDYAAWMTPPRGDVDAKAVFRLPEGVAQVSGVDAINAVVARGTPAGIAELRKLIAVLDQPIQHIRLQAMVIEMPKDQLDTKYGVPWTLSGSCRYAVGNFAQLVTAARADWQSHLISIETPIFSNGVPETLNWLQPEQPELPAGWQADLPLMVRDAVVVVPRITGTPPNESITLVIMPRIVSLIGFEGDAERPAAPVLATTGNAITLRVPNGRTILLGGLESGREVPVVERMLLLTPTVVRDSQPPE